MLDFTGVQRRTPQALVQPAAMPAGAPARPRPPSRFAALLQDNRKARIVGSATAGAARGTFTARGTTFTLPHSGASVHVPDYV